MIDRQSQAVNKKTVVGGRLFMCLFVWQKVKKFYLHIFDIAKLTAVLK